jgi:phage shock protein PspC (stress-responsive transcriptional regulator)
MKKTLTANISGTVFNIEEDAYEALQRYLASIRSQFAGSPGQDEIMGDIEGRIAELFTERLAGRREVVVMADVEHVIGIMGQPEDYMGESEDDAPGAGYASTGGGHRHKRLFRDPDDRWVGGVLSGLAAYIGADPLWLRIPFIALVFLGVGSPILIYILLWILVPTASTAAERLMMGGEPVNVDNLKKAFEEGGQRVAKDVEEMGKRWSSADHKRTADRFRTGARRAAGAGANVIGRIIGAVLVLIGISLGISLVGAVIGGSVFAFDAFDGGNTMDLLDLGGLLFPSADQALWFSIALFVLFLIPVIGILTAGLQLMLGLRAPRWLGWSLGPIWVVALITVIFIGLRLGRDFRRSETFTTEHALEQPTGQVLYLANLMDEEQSRHWHVQYNNGHMDWDMNGLFLSEDSVHGAWGRLDVRRSPDADFHLKLERRSQGRSGKASLYRSGNITYAVLQQDSLLGLSHWFAFPKEDKFRAQRLRFIVQVPVGKAIHFDPDMGFMLDDVKNVTNTLDRDMVGQTWTMTPNGLSSTVRPEDVPDDLIPQRAPVAPEPSEAPATRAKPSGNGTVVKEVRAFQMPDLFMLLRPQI